MGEAGQLLRIADTIGLEEEARLVRALGDLAGKWRDLAREVTGYASALALVRAVAEGTTDADVTAAFARLGASEVLKALQDGAARLKSVLDRIPEAVARLLQPIGAFDERAGGTRDRGLLSWPLSGKVGGDGTVGGSGSKGTYALSLGGAAALTIEAGDTWPYSDSMPGALLRLRAEGSLQAKGDVSLPFTAGSIGVSGGASANCALEYYFAVADQDRIYAAALAERLPELVDPFDFDSVWNGFAGSDLAGIHYEFNGNAAVEVALSVADLAALGRVAEAQLGATISLGFRLDGKYFLTFRADRRAGDVQPRIVATVSRQRGSTTELGLQAGVTIDFAALAARVHALLADALGEWDAVLARVKPYLSPGSWLQAQAGAVIEKQAQKLVKDDALRKALVRDLQGVVGVGTPEESELVAWVTGQLTGALDAAQGWSAGKGDAAVDALLDNLGRALPAFAQAELRKTLKESAGTLIDRAAAGLKDEVEALFKADKAALGKALQRLGAISGQAVADADAALAGVRKLVDRYDALFRKVLAATQDAARAKISAAVQIAEQRQDGAAVEITGTFLSRSDASRRIFRALTHGDFPALQKLFESGAGSADFDLDESRSSLRRYASGSRKVGIDLLLLGFGISGGDLLGAAASVTVDATGTVQVDTRANLERRFSHFDADREITLVSSFSLVAARALTNAPAAVDRAIGLAVTMGHIDDGLKRHEVDRFVGSLADAGLIAPPALVLARETFTRWAGSPGKDARLNASLILKLALDRASLASLLSLGEPVLGESRLRAIVREGYDRLYEHDPSSRSALDGTLKFLGQKQPGRSLEDFLMDARHTRLALLVGAGRSAPQLRSGADVFMNAVELTGGMRTMIEGLRAIYFSTPEVRGDDDPRTWSPKDYRKAEREAADAVEDWLRLNSRLFWTDSKVHPRTIAFLEAVANLARLEIARAFSLIMSRRDGTPETVALC
ncbi:hypothetical protein [Novosphingobium resinovorum]|uniref:hypothetical protein n=1 Tax=Novosphingobium resinovorum TaxID=158500 RepID=UPI002ED3CB00|nr:hypothetical protein [Novosphingobium resinovorum]